MKVRLPANVDLSFTFFYGIFKLRQDAVQFKTEPFRRISKGVEQPLAADAGARFRFEPLEDLLRFPIPADHIDDAGFGSDAHSLSRHGNRGFVLDGVMLSKRASTLVLICSTSPRE